MSAIQNITRRETTPGRPGLNRLLLLCRFDYNQRTWSLPTCDNAQEAELTLSLFARGLLSGAGPTTESTAASAARGTSLASSDWANPTPAETSPFKAKGVVSRAANLLRRPRPHLSPLTPL